MLYGFKGKMMVKIIKFVQNVCTPPANLGLAYGSEGSIPPASTKTKNNRRVGFVFTKGWESKRSERSQRLKSGQDVRVSERRGAYAGAARMDATKWAIHQ